MQNQRITSFSTSTILDRMDRIYPKKPLSCGEGLDHIVAERSTINAISRLSKVASKILKAPHVGQAKAFACLDHKNRVVFMQIAILNIQQEHGAPS